ncbi:hypothetical protein BH20ACT2_BH20ACT2_19760 [soil metagenome]
MVPLLTERLAHEHRRAATSSRDDIDQRIRALVAELVPAGA